MNEVEKKFGEMGEGFDKGRCGYERGEYDGGRKELKRVWYWIEDRGDEGGREEVIEEDRGEKKGMRNVGWKGGEKKKFSFVGYGEDWVGGVWGRKRECEELKGEMGEFVRREVKLSVREEKRVIRERWEKVGLIGYDICVGRNEEVKGERMKKGRWRKWGRVEMKVGLCIGDREKIEKLMFGKKVIGEEEKGEFEGIERGGVVKVGD